MSEFQVKVVEIKQVYKHSNADTLSYTEIGGPGGYPVIFRTGDFVPGGTAVYIPVDSLVDTTRPEFKFLEGSKVWHRVRAKRLRGMFSMGMLVTTPEGFKIGESVDRYLGVKKYEPPVKGAALTPSQKKALPWWKRLIRHFFPNAFIFKGPKIQHADYDLVAHRQMPNTLIEGEPVVVTEKIHGTNARYTWQNGKLWVGSHHRWLRKPSQGFHMIDGLDVWWKVAYQYEMERLCKVFPGYTFYGEIYGDVQDLTYGHEKGTVSFALFDIRDPAGRFLPPGEVACIGNGLGAPYVPILASGPYSTNMLKLAEGTTILEGDHVREGIVIEPLDPPRRIKLKHIGQGYYLRKTDD